MGIFDNIFNRSKENKWLDKDGKPKAIVSSSGLGRFNVKLNSRNKKALKQYWTYYNGEGTVFASIQTTAWNTVMVGSHYSSENDNALKLILKEMDRLDVEGVLLDNVVYTLIYGDAFIEKVKDSKGNISYLNTIDPSTMEIDYDKYGRITSYHQNINGVKKDTVFKPEEIIHIKFFPKPDSPYGISLIEPSKDTIDRKVDVDESLYHAIHRHGTSKLIAYVGTPDDIPPKDAFNEIKEDLEDIGSQNELVVPGVIKIESIDEKGVSGVEEYFSMFQTQLVIGMMCPPEALGLGQGSTEATAKVREIMNERYIRSLQLKLSNQIKNELINNILIYNKFEPNIVKMKFNSVTDADEAVKAKWLGNLLRGFPQGKLPFTINEIRAMFGYQPLEEGNVLPEIGNDVNNDNEGNDSEAKEKFKKIVSPTKV